MSVFPPLEAPTLVGPYQQVPGGMMPVPGQAPLSPAELARQRKNQQIDVKRRQGTQARQLMQQMPPTAPPVAQQPGPQMPGMGAPPAIAPAAVPIASAKPPAPAPQAPPDAYIQSQQNLINAENKLSGIMGQPAPQYQPPNKGLEYLAAGLALMFPGAPIASAAAGMLQGMQQGAEAKYQRAEQQQQEQIGAAEKQTSVYGTIADAQARVQAQLEATRERQAEYAQRHADAMSSLQEKHSEFIQTLPIKSAVAQSLIRYRVGELANQVSRNTITQQDADKRLAMTLQVAKLQEAGRDTKYAGDTAVKLAVAQTQAIDRQLDAQLRTLDAGVAADTTGQKAVEAQATAAGLIDAASSQVQGILDGVTSGRPGLGAGSGAPPPAAKTHKSISKADAVAIGKKHGWSADESVKQAESNGYTVVP